MPGHFCYFEVAGVFDVVVWCCIYIALCVVELMFELTIEEAYFMYCRLKEVLDFLRIKYKFLREFSCASMRCDCVW